MDSRYRLREGMTFEKLEQLIEEGIRRDDLENEDSEAEDEESEEECGNDAQLNGTTDPSLTEDCELRSERGEALEVQRSKEELLRDANPDLAAAIEESKYLESQLAEKELEVRRLTALVAKLQMDIRNTKMK